MWIRGVTLAEINPEAGLDLRSIDLAASFKSKLFDE